MGKVEEQIWFWLTRYSIKGSMEKTAERQFFFFVGGYILKIMYIHVRVIPKARKEVFEQEGKDRFKIAVREPALRNAANERVVELLARHFKLPSSAFCIINGHTAPTKLISIKD